MKRKSIDKKRGPSAIARKAGVSRQLASRKLKQGKTPKAIIEEAVFEREKRTGRTEARAAALKVNGHDAGHAIPPFTDSQAAKEYWLSRNRELEYKTRCGQLAEVETIQRWDGDVLSFLLNAVERWPEWAGDKFGRDGDKFGRDLEVWLNREVRKLYESVEQYRRARARHYRIRLPPPLPPSPPPEDLAYYQRYVRTGEIEQNPQEAQIGSYEWSQKHPNIDVQAMFKLRAKQRAWNKDMAQLLARRAEWDLPAVAEGGAAAQSREEPSDE